MAKRKINGKDVLLFIDSTGAGSTYDTVVCLTSTGINRTTGVESSASRCGVDSGPGDQTTTIPFAGFVVYEAETGEMANSDMNTLWKNSTEIAWKISTAAPVTGDVVQTGKGWISELNETYDQNGRASFTGTIQSGDITTTVTT